jgi:tyrosyl-tRNA synthetase
MNFYNLLKSRHLLKDCIATSDFYTNQGIYCGFDPTASSLHLGHMCTLNSLVYASSLGYNPIVILGTATALIGDPSGKTESRQLLEKETVRSNTNSLATQITNIFEKLQKNLGIHNKPLKIIENYSFYQGLGLIDFLRDVGLHFPINPLLHRDFVENREDGITYTEFSYSLLQAFDFYMLYKDHNCIGQVGGSDQWGNITSGTELIRKKLGKHSFGCTLPLLTTKDGKKFGKTEGNALFLDKDRTKSYDIYQYCYNLDDDEIEKLLYRLTFLDPARIQTILSAPSKNRTGQKALAKEIIKTLHGEREAEDVERLSELLFKEDYLKV